MRIAQIAPLHEAVPPKLYGGTERVVSYLTEELVALGHQVTLFASGDSVTSARLHGAWPRSLRLDPDIRDVTAPRPVISKRFILGGTDFGPWRFAVWPMSLPTGFSGFIGYDFSRHIVCFDFPDGEVLIR